MNICHIITRLIVGGAQENTVLTCRGLVENGHQVTLVAGPETGPEGSLWEQAVASGARTVVVKSLRRAVHPWHDVRARIELGRLLRDISPDVVHTHSSKAGIVGRAAAEGVPAVVHTIHGMSFNRTQPRAVQALYRAAEQWVGERTTAFVCVADSMVEQALAARLGPRERFVTIRSGIQTELFIPSSGERAMQRASWGVRDDEIVVGTIARLFRNKGYEPIMAAIPRALAREPRLRFVWIGDGASREAYMEQLEAMGLRDRVYLTGLIPPSSVPSYINGFDLMLHASAWEGLPRALVQGLLMCVPAVSFDNDGAPEAIQHGETGLLVPYGDTEGLADAVVELAGDPRRRREMGLRGREACLERFDWRKMVAEIERLYSACMSGGMPTAAGQKMQAPA